MNLTSCWQLDDFDARTLATCIPQEGQLRQININFTSCYRLTSVNDLLQSIAGNFSGNTLRTVFFSGGTILVILGLFWGPLALLGALVGAKWWGKVVGFDCLILSQIGLILTELC